LRDFNNARTASRNRDLAIRASYHSHQASYCMDGFGSEPRLPSRFSQYQSPQSLVELLYWSDDRLSFGSGRKPARGF